MRFTPRFPAAPGPPSHLAFPAIAQTVFLADRSIHRCPLIEQGKRCKLRRYGHRSDTAIYRRSPGRTYSGATARQTGIWLEVLGKPILIEGARKSDFGLQLRRLAQVLRSHRLDVVTRVVDESTDAKAIRRELAANLAAGDDFVLVNYARKALGQRAGATSRRSGRMTRRAIPSW